jgi:hypothetical protein
VCWVYCRLSGSLSAAAKSLYKLLLSVLLIIAATTTNPCDIIHTFAWYVHSPSHLSILLIILEQVKGLLLLVNFKGKGDVLSLHDSFCIILWFMYFGIPQVFPKCSLDGVHEFQAPLS